MSQFLTTIAICVTVFTASMALLKPVAKYHPFVYTKILGFFNLHAHRYIAALPFHIRRLNTFFQILLLVSWFILVILYIFYDQTGFGINISLKKFTFYSGKIIWSVIILWACFFVIFVLSVILQILVSLTQNYLDQGNQDAETLLKDDENLTGRTKSRDFRARIFKRKRNLDNLEE